MEVIAQAIFWHGSNASFVQCAPWKLHGWFLKSDPIIMEREAHFICGDRTTKTIVRQESLKPIKSDVS